MCDCFDAYNQWFQWLPKQKTCPKQQFVKSTPCIRRARIDVSDLEEVNLKNKEKLSYPRLIFSVEAGQCFWIGEDIQIMVLRCSQGIIHLGIEGPLSTTVEKYAASYKESLL